MMPVKADGTPLRALPEFEQNPHAWVKLWKHHAPAQADKINETARRLGQAWLDRYGGKISSEWFFSKALQILEEAPEVYRAADRLIEAADWVIWRLSGVESRNTCTAGYKAMVQDGDYPPREYFAALHPDFADVIDTKMMRTFAQLGDRVGGLTEEAAAWTGLKPGIAIATAKWTPMSPRPPSKSLSRARWS
jgi:L-ribulokinase